MPSSRTATCYSIRPVVRAGVRYWIGKGLQCSITAEIESFARPCFCWRFVVLAVFGTAGSPAAQTTNVYEVTGVAVDVTAETAAAARDKALALRGDVKAFRRLLERLTLRTDHPRLPEI